ncbi:MAG: guanylate kinase [Chloroflexi bacterium RBG_13_57_8]|nr:MAG: guanylate kinase [Chloroflexi bacterium RBG_13_57_8]
MSRKRSSPLHPLPQPLFIVLSGLSGAGKDTVLAGLRKANLPLYISVSATTRPRRKGEKEGADYFFVSAARFQELIESDQLLEWATVYGNRYGIPRGPVREALQSGRDIVVKIDVQGAATIKKKVPGAVFIFLLTPHLEELEKRLARRRTENAADLELRLQTAAEELRRLPLFDYVVINRTGEVDRAVADITAIINAEKCRVKRRKLSL